MQCVAARSVARSHREAVEAGRDAREFFRHRSRRNRQSEGVRLEAVGDLAALVAKLEDAGNAPGWVGVRVAAREAHPALPASRRATYRRFDCALHVEHAFEI